jgi:hypothetical protein
MGERLGSTTLEKLSPEELRNRHLDTLRFFLLPPSTLENRLSLDCLTGPALDISNKDGAGIEALEELGIENVTGICLPTTRLYYLDEEILENREKLVERLKFIPDNTIRLATIFDHSDNFISTQTAREIERVLVPEGQCLITCRDMSKTPQDDEGFPRIDGEIEGPVLRGLMVLARVTRAPRLLRLSSWHQMGDSYAPNRFAAVYTKPGRQV